MSNKMSYELSAIEARDEFFTPGTDWCDLKFYQIEIEEQVFGETFTIIFYLWYDHVPTSSEALADCGFDSSLNDQSVTITEAKLDPNTHIPVLPD